MVVLTKFWCYCTNDWMVVMRRFIFALLVLLCSVSALAQTTQWVAPNKSTGSWTSATSQNTAVTVTVRNLAMVKVTLHATSTMSAGVLSFENDDGTAVWWGTPCTRDGGSDVTGLKEKSYMITAPVDQTWDCAISAFTSFRVRLSTVITGSGTATVNVLATAAPAMPSFFSIGNGSISSTDATTQARGHLNVAEVQAYAFIDDGTQHRSLSGRTNGAANMLPFGDGLLVKGAVTSAMTGTTSTSVIAGVSSNFLYITACTVSNGSLTVSTDINLQDGSGGTTIYVLPAPAGQTATTGAAGGAYVFPTPLYVPTAGNGLFAANVTTGSSTKISCVGYKSTTQLF